MFFSLILFLEVCVLNASEQLADELPVYDEPASIYHGCWRRALCSDVNGWRKTSKLYEDDEYSFDENDHIRSAYSNLITALHHQRYLKFGDIHEFRQVAAIYENTIRLLGTSNHPLVAYTYLQYINFINKHSVSRKVDELTQHVGNVVCYLNAHWSKPEGDDSITFIEVEAYKVLSMFYASHAHHLYRKAVTASDENEKNEYLKQRDEALNLAKDKVNMALSLCKGDKQREILEQKHLAPISTEKERIDEVKAFSFKTVAYVGAVEEYINGDSCKVLLDGLEDLLTEQEYLPVFHTQIPWFKPVVRKRQNTQQHFPQQQVLQQSVPVPSPSEQFCMCHDCNMMRSNILWCYQNIPSTFQSNDHFYFEAARFAEMVEYFHGSFTYIDDAGKDFILNTLTRLMNWPDFLSPFERDLFTSIESRINASRFRASR